MLTDKSQGIQEYIADRLFKIHESILVKDGEYRELAEASARRLSQLLTKAGPKLRNLVDDYDCSRALRMNRQDELYMLQYVY